MSKLKQAHRHRAVILWHALNVSNHMKINPCTGRQLPEYQGTQHTHIFTQMGGGGGEITLAELYSSHKEIQTT